ncbi:hypothetical protein ACWS81_08125 [Psychrobacter celer]
MSLSACDDQPTVSQTDTIKKPLVMEAKLPSTAAVIECAQLTPKQTVTIKGHQILSKSCDFTGQSIRFALSDSHSSLDRQGAQLSPSADDSSMSAIISNALSRVVTILFAVMFFKMSQWAYG